MKKKLMHTKKISLRSSRKMLSLFYSLSFLRQSITNFTQHGNDNSNVLCSVRNSSPCISAEIKRGKEEEKKAEGK